MKRRRQYLWIILILIIVIILTLIPTSRGYWFNIIEKTSGEKVFNILVDINNDGEIPDGVIEIVRNPIQNIDISPGQVLYFEGKLYKTTGIYNPTKHSLPDQPNRNHWLLRISEIKYSPSYVYEIGTIVFHNGKYYEAQHYISPNYIPGEMSKYTWREVKPMTDSDFELITGYNLPDYSKPKPGRVVYVN